MKNWSDLELIKEALEDLRWEYGAMIMDEDPEEVKDMMKKYNRIEDLLWRVKNEMREIKNDNL